MIYDILKVFKKEYEKSGDELILGSYSLKDGLYVKINSDNSIDYYVVKDNLLTDLKNKQNSDIYDWLKKRDYYSNVVNTAKSYDTPAKSIHNNNYLTLFMKSESLYKVDKKHLRNKLFLTVISFNKFSNNEDKSILEKYIKNIKKLSRQKDIVEKYKTLLLKLDDIIEKSKELENKNYVKVFFDEDLEMYKEESEIYLALKIFNKNNYNKEIENKIYGLSNANMGLNSKKPYLENKTKKLNIPFLIENSDALMLKKFFDWLKIQPYRDENKKAIDRYLEERFYIQKQSKNDEAEISDFDYIPLKSDDVKKKFDNIYVKNYLKVKKDKELVLDYEIKDLWQLEKVVDEVFYNKQLIFNYYKDAKDIKVSDFLSKNLQGIVYSTRYEMNNYFRKYVSDKKDFYKHIKKFAREFVFEYLKEKDEKKIYFAKQKANEALNLKLSLKKHYEGVEMDIEEELKNIRRLLTRESYAKLSKEEFLFLSAQWAYYLLSLSRADNKNKTFSFAERYFKAKDIQKIQDVLKVDLEKYKHAIRLNNSKAKKAIALIKAYDSNEKLSSADKDRFLVGFSVENVFYDKKKEEENK